MINSVCGRVVVHVHFQCLLVTTIMQCVSKFMQLILKYVMIVVGPGIA